MSPTMRDSANAPATTRPGRAIASFSSDADAERAVDHPADKRFPVDRVAEDAARLRSPLTGLPATSAPAT